MNISFDQFSIELNLAIFGGAALVVLVAGTKLAGYADAIARRAGLNQAFIGALLPGFATSPRDSHYHHRSGDRQRSVSSGKPFRLRSHADRHPRVGRSCGTSRALTWSTPQPILLSQGVMLLLLLAVALAGVALGDPITVLEIGLTSFLLFAGYLFTLRISRNPELRHHGQFSLTAARGRMKS